MIIVISIASHYLLMLMASRCFKIERGIEAGHVWWEKGTHADVWAVWGLLGDSCWSQADQIPLCRVMTQHEAWH